MVPIYEQLVEGIKEAIIKEELLEGEALPSVRSLAKELRISALTVKKAYDRLEEAGFVTTIHGKGTFVNAADRSLAIEARRKEVEERIATTMEYGVQAGLSVNELREITEIILEDLT